MSLVSIVRRGTNTSCLLQAIKAGGFYLQAHLYIYIIFAQIISRRFLEKYFWKIAPNQIIFVSLMRAFTTVLVLKRHSGFTKFWNKLDNTANIKMCYFCSSICYCELNSWEYLYKKGWFEGKAWGWRVLINVKF